ncbi:MAG: hypothetical protein HFJ35_04755 [Clostridia bacterium]|nr:hypothetical protein [Clostridia bacterium]
MKKLFLGIITTMLLLTIVLPLSVNAATFITKTASEISTGEIVELEIQTSSKVESMQFDVEFNPDQFEYVIDSAESELSETASNYIASNKVRVSAYGVAEANGQQPVADTVTMKFKAKTTASGNSSFKIGAVEIGENGTTESVDGGEVEVKVNGKVVDNDKLDGYEEYIDDYGNEIKTIGQWGYIPPIRIYDDLVASQNIVAYALPYSDDVIKVENLKAEFGNQIEVIGADSNGVVGTGDTFKLNAMTYTILIYGDVNGDGKVTTADALTTTKYEGKGILNTTKEQALKVVKTGKNKTNAKAQQEFILGNPEGTVKKEGYPLILDAYPEKIGEAQDIDLIDGINVNSELESVKKPYRYNNFKIATVSSNNNVAILNKEGLTAEIKLGDKVVSDDIATVTYTPSNTPNAFTMTFCANVAGDYTITPILVGANVEGGVLNKNQKIELTVEEDPTITDIKIADLESTGKVFVKTGKEKTIGLSFVHKYTNNGEEGSILVNKDQMEITEINETYLSKNDTDFVVDENGYVTGIKVQANNEPTTETALKIAVTDVDGLRTEQTINIEIQKARTVGITFNHKELSHTVTKADTVNLYVDTEKAPNENNITEIVDDDDGFEDTILVGILPIAIRDEYGNTTFPKYSDIEKSFTETEGKIAIYEVASSTKKIGITQIRYYTEVNGEYQYLKSPQVNDRIAAIGIYVPTVSVTLDEVVGSDGMTFLEYLGEGFNITYDTLNGRQTAHIPVRVFKNRIDLLEEIEEGEQPSPTAFSLSQPNDIVETSIDETKTSNESGAEPLPQEEKETPVNSEELEATDSNNNNDSQEKVLPTQSTSSSEE